MKKQNQKLVPKLRFPEFTGEWGETSLQEQVCYENGKAHENEINAQGQYVVVNSKFISTDGEIRKFTNQAYCLARRNDILMVLSDVPNGKAIAKCFYVDEDEKYTVNQRICRLTSINDNSGFLFFIINKNSYFLSFDDGVKQTNLRKEDVLSCPLIIPQKVEEQQKIADCLTTLDEKINAQSQKIEQLKAHKKGLMQKIFPAEGQIVPSLRFPEFADAGEWEESSLSTYLKESRLKGSKGDTAKKITVKLWGQGVFPKKEALTGSTNTQYFKRKANQFIYSKLDFLNQAFGIIPSQLDNYESTVDLPCFDISNDLHPYFLLEYVRRKEFYKKYGELADGGRKAKRIQVDAFLSFPIICPIFKEQQKIADAFTSLDALIAIHIQKLDELKEYKKGLMQQLFIK